MLKAGCYGTEIAANFDMHEETFYNRVQEKYGMGFTAYSSEKRKAGESLLRIKQFEKALGITTTGDNTLLIWLGKQRLNQREPEAIGSKTAPTEATQVTIAQMKDANGENSPKPEAADKPQGSECSN